MAEPVRTREELAVATILTVRDTCGLLGVGTHTLRKNIRAGVVPCIQLGRTWRIPAAYVREVLGVAEPGDVAPQVRAGT